MKHYCFISTKYRNSSRLTLFTFLLAFIVILLGAYTRLTDAGLSCPDWPHCYGYITAPHTPAQLQDAAQKYPLTPINVKKAWTEMTHRYFAGMEAILILILSFTLLFAYRKKSDKSSAIAYSLIGLLGIQVLLGMLTVTEKLKPIIVLSHLLIGISLLSLLWVAHLDLYLRNHSSFLKDIQVKLIPWIWIALTITACQITLGGWVSTHYAGLACIDFPYCNGKLLPAIQWNNLNSDLITIQMLHRIGALATATYLSLFALFLLRYRTFRATGLLIFALITLQITLGILNIIWLRPVWIALTHQAVAIILLLTIITLAAFKTENKHDSWAS